MKDIFLLLSLLAFSNSASADEAVIKGGYFPANNSDVSEYFAHITAIDGSNTKNVNYKTRSQIVHVAPGEHLLDVTCGYKYEGGNYASTPKINMLFEKNGKYILSGDIHMPSERNKYSGYCTVAIIKENG
jgi:hypothetical protein